MTLSMLQMYIKEKVIVKHFRVKITFYFHVARIDRALPRHLYSRTYRW